MTFEKPMMSMENKKSPASKPWRPLFNKSLTADVWPSEWKQSPFVAESERLIAWRRNDRLTGRRRLCPSGRWRKVNYRLNQATGKLDWILTRRLDDRCCSDTFRARKEETLPPWLIGTARAKSERWSATPWVQSTSASLSSSVWTLPARQTTVHTPPSLQAVRSFVNYCSKSSVDRFVRSLMSSHHALRDLPLPRVPSNTAVFKLFWLRTPILLRHSWRTPTLVTVKFTAKYSNSSVTA